MKPALVALCVALAGCTLPEKPKPNITQEIIDSLVYARDRHGNCLAIVVTSTYYNYKVASIASVERGCQ